MTINEEIALRFVQWRSANRISDIEIAQLLDIEISRILNVESIAQAFRQEELSELGKKVDIDLHWLLTGKSYLNRKK